MTNYIFKTKLIYYVLAYLQSRETMNFSAMRLNRIKKVLRVILSRVKIHTINMPAHTCIYMSSITTVSKLFKIVKHLFSSSAFRRHCFMFKSVCVWACVFVCILVYICNDLGKRLINRVYLWMIITRVPSAVGANDKLSPVSAKVLLCLLWSALSFAKHFTAVVEFRGISWHSGA